MAWQAEGWIQHGDKLGGVRVGLGLGWEGEGWTIDILDSTQNYFLPPQWRSDTVT